MSCSLSLLGCAAWRGCVNCCCVGAWTLSVAARAGLVSSATPGATWTNVSVWFDQGRHALCNPCEIGQSEQVCHIRRGCLLLRAVGWSARLLAFLAQPPCCVLAVCRSAPHRFASRCSDSARIAAFSRNSRWRRMDSTSRPSAPPAAPVRRVCVCSRCRCVGCQRCRRFVGSVLAPPCVSLKLLRVALSSAASVPRLLSLSFTSSLRCVLALRVQATTRTRRDSPRALRCVACALQCALRHRSRSMLPVVCNPARVLSPARLSSFMLFPVLAPRACG